MNLLQVIERKKEKEEESKSVIGTEIKLMRQSQSKTLEQVSSDICSPSYICKIERNSIKGNHRCLEQICERLHISKNNIETLQELSSVMLDAVEFFYYDNDLKLKQIYNEVKEFNNFRVKIIKLIYNIYFKNYLICQNLILELEKLTVSMSTSDILIYSLFKSIYQIKESSFEESVIILKYLIDNNEYKEISYALAVEYLEKAYFYMDSPYFLNDIKKLEELHTKFMNISHLEEFRFSQCIYYFLKNDMYRFDKVSKKKISIKYENTIVLLKNIMSGEDSKKEEFVSPFYDVLYYFYYNKELYKTYDLEKLSILEILYLKYQECKNNEVDLTNIIDELIPSSYKISNLYLIEGFTSKAIDILKNNSKYKQAVELMENLGKIKRHIQTLW